MPRNAVQSPAPAVRRLSAVHCPETSNCSKSTYVLRNKLEAVAEYEVHTFCSICFKELRTPISV